MRNPSNVRHHYASSVLAQIWTQWWRNKMADILYTSFESFDKISPKHVSEGVIDKNWFGLWVSIVTWQANVDILLPRIETRSWCCSIQAKWNKGISSRLLWWEYLNLKIKFHAVLFKQSIKVCFVFHHNLPHDRRTDAENHFTHYNDVIMGTMTSQITSLTIAYSTVYSGADQRKHQSSASLAFVRGIHWWKTSNAENVSIWWRHHELIAQLLKISDTVRKAISEHSVSLVTWNQFISPEGYEEWHPHNWPVTTTNHLPPHLANYLGHQRVSVFV